MLDKQNFKCLPNNVCPFVKSLIGPNARIFGLVWQQCTNPAYLHLWRHVHCPTFVRAFFTFTRYDSVVCYMLYIGPGLVPISDGQLTPNFGWAD